MHIAAQLLAATVLLGAEASDRSNIQAETKTAQRFQVVCHFSGTGIDGLTTNLVVEDGKNVNAFCGDSERKSIVIGKNTDSPMKRSVPHGISLDVHVTKSGDDKAILEVSFQLAGVGTDTEEEGDANWMARKYQVIKRVPLGKKTVTSFGDFGMDVLVKAMPRSESDVTKPQPTHGKQVARN